MKDKNQIKKFLEQLKISYITQDNGEIEIAEEITVEKLVEMMWEGRNETEPS